MSVANGTIVFAASAVTGVLGTLVAGIAYRGARRNNSETMRALAVGVLCVTLCPFLVTYGVAPLASLSDAETLLGVFAVYNTGLLSFLYSLELA